MIYTLLDLLILEVLIIKIRFGFFGGFFKSENDQATEGDRERRLSGVCFQGDHGGENSAVSYV